MGSTHPEWRVPIFSLLVLFQLTLCHLFCSQVCSRMLFDEALLQ